MRWNPDIVLQSRVYVIIDADNQFSWDDQALFSEVLMLFKNPPHGRIIFLFFLLLFFFFFFFCFCSFNCDFFFSTVNCLFKYHSDFDIMVTIIISTLDSGCVIHLRTVSIFYPSQYHSDVTWNEHEITNSSVLKKNVLTVNARCAPVQPMIESDRIRINSKIWAG